MKVHEVFGISPSIQPASYIDRLSLDDVLKKLINRKQKHVAIRGASKCGKSWLRQSALTDPIIVQCRLDKSAEEIYVNALSQLGVKLEIESKSGSSFKGKVSASGELGIKLLAKAKVSGESEYNSSDETKEKSVGQDISDLRFVVNILKESGRTLVIEDFHYMSVEERTRFAFDLKALWDYQYLVVIIGVWSLDNMLLSLNPDLSGRIEELSISWPPNELEEILDKGASYLNIDFTPNFKRKIIEISFGSSGILQELALKSLDELHFEGTTDNSVQVDSLEAIEGAAMQYADQLNPLYQEFAKRVSSGIRARPNSTGIYAYAMAVILASSDKELIDGIDAQTIYKKAHEMQPRIQLSNLKTILQKFEELQIDEGGRGLILSYNPATEKITVVDRQLLLYRMYQTIKWPWEELMKQSDTKPECFEGS